MRTKQKVVPFDWKVFSKKQLTALFWWSLPEYKHYDAIICDGAVRSGKTVSLTYSYVNWAMETYNECNFALCGKTISALRRNVVVPLKRMLCSSKFSISDNHTENVLTITQVYKDGDKVVEHRNYFYIFGGKDESSQDLIQGITLAGVLFDEVALMPQSFVNQATARCSVEGAKFWFNCNPASPFHWFKEEWLDKLEHNNALHLHFTMDDNLSLSKEVKERYKRLYTGVFYKRYILGQWVASDGAVYPMFDVDVHVKTVKKPWTRYFMSADFGMQNATTFGIFGYYAPTKHYHELRSYYHSGRDEGQLTTKEYVDEAIKLIKESMIIPEYITVDPAGTSLIVELRKNSFFKRHNIKIIPAKNNVELGIQAVSYLLNEHKFTLDPSCVKDIEEFTTYVWDSDKLDKGKEEVVKINDHAMDKIRYAILTDSIINRTMSTQLQIWSGKGALE